jgi:diacylglycerol kinase (CTP)
VLRRNFVLSILDPVTHYSFTTFIRHHRSVSDALRRSPPAKTNNHNSDDDADNAWPRKRHPNLSPTIPPWPLPLRLFNLRPVLAGAAVPLLPALPPFFYQDPDEYTMARRSRNIPATPRVISPSPDPTSEPDGTGLDKSSSYTGPTTRSAARRRAVNPPQPTPAEQDEIDDTSSEPELARARTRSRSPVTDTKRALRPLTGSKSATANGDSVKPATPQTNGHLKPDGGAATPTTNGHLLPPGASTAWSWRDLSRSPSPLGLIPIHRRWHAFVHRHEVPRKALHVSIGFFVVWLYLSGTQTRDVCPYLMGALIPIAAVDVARHHYQPFNRLYIRVLGLLMRESEYAGYNGVIFYLLGAWAVLYFFPKDVGVMGTLLLSWCDTAASTFGRLYGRYTPRIRKGKSLAGSTAAFLVGVATSVFFWGWLAPVKGPMPGDEMFMFTGSLGLPAKVAGWLGLEPAAATITGGLALGAVSLWSGLVAAASEVVDLFGWDDNLTIPVLSGLGIWGFLKIFG